MDETEPIESGSQSEAGEPESQPKSDSFDPNKAFDAVLSPGGFETWMAFEDYLDEHRGESNVTIELDWNQFPLDDPNKTRGVMRKLKAFLEMRRPAGQKRAVIIRGTREERDAAAKIEANVLSSGVSWLYPE